MVKKIGLVLSGGGARGFYHAGVFNAIKKSGFMINEITGTSIGAVIGAIIAENPDRDLIELVEGFEFSKSLKWTGKKGGLLDSKKVEEYAKVWVKSGRFEDLKIPLRITATDINTGEELVFDKGPLFPALVASMAVPGIYPPVKYKRRILSDGGVMNNMPVHLIKKSEYIVLSDIDLPTYRISNQSPAKEIMQNAFILPRKQVIKDKLSLLKNKKIIHLKANLDISIIDFRKSKRELLYKKGYRDAMRKLKQWC